MLPTGLSLLYHINRLTTDNPVKEVENAVHGSNHDTRKYLTKNKN